ncbi:hypothetical protein RugamoR64_59620 [Duganella rhizosphaerae]|uniref:hypothetical protein n=1 Tax=Duganella rhizosphaerae TaxID=2885763 RepID=UPI0030EA42BE
MRQLNQKEMKAVAGGSTPQMVCANPTVNTTSNRDGSSTSVTTQICQTGSGLTVINTSNVTSIEVGFGASAIGKILGLEADVKVINSSSSTTVCTSTKDCTVLKTSDASTGSSPTFAAGGGHVSDSGGHGSNVFDMEVEEG